MVLKPTLVLSLSQAEQLNEPTFLGEKIQKVSLKYICSLYLYLFPLIVLIISANKIQLT